MKFVVEGEMRISGEGRKFVKEIEAASKERAGEIALKKIGADHKLKRTQIKIDSVNEWKD
ncbi:50S ribosomal protein L18a [Candidatus Micrarchaeota archaeon CG10_big_fil_rev_8_21_14_0_10_45_29]|nr:MAG: 50S ribosomal protein L18a [Candidatus Micrarchaeota archaeon CG10_big_fil_rev_8_21_14_0_10_45_29]